MLKEKKLFIITFYTVEKIRSTFKLIKIYFCYSLWG